MAVLGEQVTAGTAMVKVVYTSTDAIGLVAGTYPFIQATAGTDLFIGVQAGNSNTGTTAQKGANTGVGFQALLGNTTGINNTTVGLQALFSNTTGSYNTAVGLQALLSNTTGNNNTAVGLQALYFYNNTTSIDGFNVAIGYYAGHNYHRDRSRQPSLLVQTTGVA
ncbi:hemagluttinin family protein, partial [mine drainage metagenome]